MVLDAGFELSVRTDKVSIEYRRWLHELVEAAAVSPSALTAALRTATASRQGAPS
jgi:hypothetical protein